MTVDKEAIIMVHPKKKKKKEEIITVNILWLILYTSSQTSADVVRQLLRLSKSASTDSSSGIDKFIKKIIHCSNIVVLHIFNQTLKLQKSRSILFKTHMHTQPKAFQPASQIHWERTKEEIKRNIRVKKSMMGW